MTAAFFVSIAVSLVFGFLLVWNTWQAKPRPAPVVTILAFPAGCSLTSAMYFFWLILSGGRSNLYPFVESALLVLLLGLTFYRYRQNKNSSLLPPNGRWKVDLPAALSILSLLAAGALCLAIPVKLAKVNPWGYWDAWARINVKSRFLFAGGEHWTWIFESDVIAHHDYPLLIQCFTARTWTWVGDVSQAVPQVLSVAWGLFSLLTLFSLVAWLRTPVTAVIAGMAYLTFTPLLLWSAMQYADIPLGCYMLLSCGMMVAAASAVEKNPHFIFLAGFFAGSAAWCKNEGIAFAALVALWCVGLMSRKPFSVCRQTAVALLAGIACIGSAVLTLKLAFAGETDVLFAPPHSVTGFGALMGSGERHQLILKFLWEHLALYWRGWPLLLLGIALMLHGGGRSQRVGSWMPLACVVAMAGLYYGIFFSTPYDLQWHLGTAMDRLILQVWPVFLLGLAVFFEEKRPAGSQPDESKTPGAGIAPGIH